MRIFKPWMLHIWAISIAIILWVQVHGEGEGTLSLDALIQLQGLPDNMVIVNNLPSKVRITIQGLQARLKTLQGQDVFIPLNVSDLSEPAVVQRAFDLEDIHLPAGLSIEKIQPDHLELQIDRIVTRTVGVHAVFDLPDEWEVHMVSVKPAMVHIQGPEVWLESLTSVDTLPLKPTLKAGAFSIKADIIVPAEKSVHLEEDKIKFTIKGMLSRKVVVQPNITLRPEPQVDKVNSMIITQHVEEPYSQGIAPIDLPSTPEITVEPYSIELQEPQAIDSTKEAL